MWLLFHVYAVLFGLVFGSFANVAILRLPDDQSLWPRSRCPRCGNPVRARDNVPVLSWVLLRGRCRDCAAKIPATYPATELLGGLLGALLYRRFVPDAGALDAAHLTGAAVYLVLAIDLVIASFSDVRRRIIPDETSIYAVPVMIGAAGLLGALGLDDPLALGWRGSVLGAAVCGLSLGLIAWTANQLAKAEALGWGDVKLFALIGAAVGALPGGFVVMMLSSFAGAFFGLGLTLLARRRVWLPFGPVLAGSAVAWILWGDILGPALVPGMIQLFDHR